MLEDYISLKVEFVKDLNVPVTFVNPKKKFVDDEFTDNDLLILDLIVTKLGGLSATELSKLTHSKGGLWYKTAKENDILDKFESNVLRASNYKINFKPILDENKKMIYDHYLKSRSISRSYNV